MLILVFVLMTLGIVQSQALSRSDAVTLRWLRLGDLIGISLLAVTGLMIGLQWREPASAPAAQVLVWPAGVMAIGILLHLVVVQLGRRALQRVIAISTVAIVAALVANWLRVTTGSAIITTTTAPRHLLTAIEIGDATMPAWSGPVRAAGLSIGFLLAAWMIGGSLMTMLLGHAYLTAGGEMTQRPFERLGKMLMLGMLLRALVAASSCFAWMWWISVVLSNEGLSTWTLLLLTVRFLIGVAVPAALVWMAVQCVKIRSYQSATGIFYVASLMIFIGELTALSLVLEAGWIL